MNMSQTIVIDSGGIQEEGAVLGKKKRKRNTDSAGECVGRSYPVYGGGRAIRRGRAAEGIVSLVHWYLRKAGPMHINRPPILNYSSTAPFDLVVILTVWEWDTLSIYLETLAK